MTTDPLAPRASQRYLITASTPTPNGRLHLGHIAGPYLRADLLARHWRSRGQQVVFASGLDSYESYVLARAQKDGRPADQVAHHFGALIRRDLVALDIEPDVWIDPLEDSWRDVYHSTCRGLMARLIGAGAVEVHTVPLLYAASQDRFLTGCWLNGRCPVCGRSAAGSSCEECGSHFPPYRMMQPRDSLGCTDLREEAIDHMLLRLDYEPLERYVAKVALAEPFRQRGLEALKGRDFHARLLTPGDWGVTWPRASACPGSVLFTYAFNLGFGLLFGEEFRRLTGDGRNPFEADSTVHLVATVGVDVLMPRLVILPAMAGHLGYRGYDRLVVNRFYTLAGKKFSTSRGHAIWAEDIVTKTPASADAVRYYLAQTGPDVQERDFDPGGFIRCNNELVGRLAPLLAGATPDSGQHAPPALLGRLCELIREQDETVEREPLELPRYAGTLDRYLQEPVGDDVYGWLRCWAVLCWPVMPRLAEAVWTRLGLAGQPVLAGLQQAPRARASWGIAPRELTGEDLVACLPPSLTAGP